MSDSEYRYYIDENGEYLRGFFSDDPIPPEYTLFTLIVPPSFERGESTVIEIWDFSEERWYLPFSIQRLKQHRDKQIFIVIEHNNGVSSFDVLNDQESYNALSRICQGIPIENSPTGFIKWKNLDGEYQNASYQDIQSLFFLCFRREQDCRNAEESTLAAHAITPYVDLADAIYYFDQQL